MLEDLLQKVRHFRPLTYSLVLVLPLFIVSACKSHTGEVAQVPRIIGFAFTPPDSQFLPNDEIGIRVKVNESVDDYQWWLDEGNGKIESGNHTPLITYIAPDKPGFYHVHVLVVRATAQVSGTATITVSHGTLAPESLPQQKITPSVSLSGPTSTSEPISAAEIRTVGATVTEAAEIATATTKLSTLTPLQQSTTSTATVSSPSPATQEPVQTGESRTTQVPASPTTKPTLRATPAPTHELPAVNLMDPPDSASFSGKGDHIELRWSADKPLLEGIYFFVDGRFTGIDENGVCREDWLYFKWTRDTSFPVAPWLYDEMCPAPDRRGVRWTVYVGQPANGVELPDALWLESVSGGRRQFDWIIQGGDADEDGGGGGIDQDPGVPID